MLLDCLGYGTFCLLPLSLSYTISNSPVFRFLSLSQITSEEVCDGYARLKKEEIEVLS